MLTLFNTYVYSLISFPYLITCIYLPIWEKSRDMLSGVTLTFFPGINEYEKNPFSSILWQFKIVIMVMITVIIKNNQKYQNKSKSYYFKYIKRFMFALHPKFVYSCFPM